MASMTWDTEPIPAKLVIGDKVIDVKIVSVSESVDMEIGAGKNEPVYYSDIGYSYPTERKETFVCERTTYIRIGR